MAGLIAHKDTTYVNELMVKAVPEPAWTDSWHPVSPARVIDNLEAGIAGMNLRVTGKDYSLNESGTRMFGVWRLDDMVIDGMGLAIGFRNAIDKTMKLGFCAGLTVFICDNMALSGDFIRFRKHTSGLNDESLQQLTMEALDQVVTKMEKYRDSINGLKEIPVIEGPMRNRFALPFHQEFWMDDDGTVRAGLLETEVFKGIMLDMAMYYNIFPITKIPSFIDAFLTESATAVTVGYPVNSWYTIFNAVTRVCKGESMFSVAKSTAAVERMIRKAAKIDF